ncbi:nucleoside diphosphate kinase regulator [Desulfobacter hydrogenophilus]|uniref:Nucleoside diphosphate kinase regulator n=1 Tax=Desulfobacter hydrogenophilus TaxID=2291 RepID=A0A328FHY3_9BACT|nr:nucleoside diphosphate kinase regulator [Desulfobacter hydrogenophilus]NDY71852.1 nucleoside diphosphate kinase regulator [Desulfobacter hydrogenophilus]QBH12014.1 nucleoside diphosphate kinase regulator [Desulfobacter hydrogenophilus]RAM02627.1 nucleoside diphosphate kinase regulator [Desulfobacter hydrogenophilus]
MEKELLITKFDLDRLESLLDLYWGHNGFDEKNLESLEKKISNCIVVPPEFIPNNIITMNSTFTVENEVTNEKKTYTLVFPEDADIKGNKISILAPIGIAILGHKVGQSIEWVAPSGLKKLKFIKIHYQPETCGQFNL